MAPSTASRSQTKRHIQSLKDPKSAPQREKNVWRAHAQYYAAITFNQIVLSTSATDRAAAQSCWTSISSSSARLLVNGSLNWLMMMQLLQKKRLKTRERDQSLRRKGPEEKRKEVRGAAGFAEVQDANAKATRGNTHGHKSCFAVRAVRWRGRGVRFSLLVSLA